MATLREVLSIVFQVLQVSLTQVGWVHRELLVGHFQAVEARPLLEGKVQYVGVSDLKDYDVVLGVAKVGQAVHHRIKVTETV